MLAGLPDETVALVAAQMHARDVDATVAIVHASGDVRAISQHMGFDAHCCVGLKKAILRSEQARLCSHANEWPPSTRRCTRFTETSAWASPGLIVRDSRMCPWVITRIHDEARVCIRPLHAATEKCVRAWAVQGRRGKRYVLSAGAFVTGERFVLHALV